MKVIASIKQLAKKGFFHILIGGTISKIVIFMSSILIVRFISKEEYAYLAYTDNIYSYIIMLMGFGCDSAVLKYCISDDKKKNTDYVILAGMIGIITQLIVSIVLLIYINNGNLLYSNAKKFVLLLLIYPLVSYLLSVFQCFLRARLYNAQYAYFGIMQAVLLFVVTFVFVGKLNGSSVILGRYIAAIVVTFLILFYIRQDIVLSTKIHLSKQKAIEFIKYGLSIMIANVFSMIMPINEEFLVNHIIADEIATANYKVASMLPRVLTFVASAICIYAFSGFARLVDKDKIWKNSIRLGKITFLIISFCLVIGISISSVFIDMVYGDQYKDIGQLMFMMWLVYGFNAAIRMLPLNILPAIGYTKFNMIISITTCGIHLILDYIFIKNMGIYGVAFAGITVYLLSGMCYWLYLRKVTVQTKYTK